MNAEFEMWNAESKGGFQYEERPSIPHSAFPIPHGG